MPVKIEIETALSDRHHINAPRFVWFVIYLDENRQWLSPSRLELCCTRFAYEHVGITIIDLDGGGEMDG